MAIIVEESVRPAGKQRKVTFEEYLESAPEARIREWVDGEVFEYMPNSLPHQLLVKFLIKLLDEFVVRYKLGLVLPAPFVMRLRVVPSGREPDVLFVRAENEHTVQNTYVDGPADLAVEIVSPDSGRRDRIEKMSEYERAGVREYWILDPKRKTAEFYLGSRGKYARISIGVDNRYDSAAIDGLWIDVNWLWQNPSPPLADIWKAWGIE